MILRNPCRECLVKPCCKISCPEQEEFQKFSETIIPLIFFGISVLIILSFIYLLFHNINNSTVLAISILLIWIIGVIINVVLLELQIKKIICFSSDFLDVIALCCISPFMSITFILLLLYRKFDKIEGKLF